MKKFLFCTTALAVAGAFAFSGQANAAAKPLKIGVGGFMASQMGVGSNSGSFEDNGTADTADDTNRRDAFNTVQDSEIYFTGSTKMDNGVTLSVTVQLEGDQARGGTIDESYMKLTGGFGDIRIGSVTGPVSTLKKTAPYVGFRLDGGDTNNYITVPTNATASASTNQASSGDFNKIVYISPVVAGGLRLGVAWTPSLTTVDTAPAIAGNNASDTQVMEASISYETKMGTSDVKLDIGAESASGTSAATHRGYRAGLNVTAGGITVGGGWAKRENMNSEKANTTNSDERRTFDLGVKYATGAYTFGIAMTDGEHQTEATADDTVRKWGVGMTYALSTGVTVAAGYYHADFDDSGSALADNNDGHALIGQIKVAF